MKIFLIAIFCFGLSGLKAQTVKDIDGNVYKTVTIGSQTWMTENLKVTHYRNGDPIPNVTDNQDWSELTTGALCDYNNSTFYGSTYGKLYNWYTVADPRLLCPSGWHIPGHAQWDAFTSYLGGEQAAGDKLKEGGTSHWRSHILSSATDGTNDYGFCALPGGSREKNGSFMLSGAFCYWWTSSFAPSTGEAENRHIFFDNSALSAESSSKKNGFSLRCMKD